MFDELARLLGATQEARLAGQTEADGTDDGRLPRAIRTDDDVKVWPRVKLHCIVCTVRNNSACANCPIESSQSFLLTWQWRHFEMKRCVFPINFSSGHYILVSWMLNRRICIDMKQFVQEEQPLTMHVLPGFHLNMALKVIYEALGELSIKQRAITLNAASKRGEGMAVYTLSRCIHSTCSHITVDVLYVLMFPFLEELCHRGVHAKPSAILYPFCCVLG